MGARYLESHHAMTHFLPKIAINIFLVSMARWSDGKKTRRVINNHVIWRRVQTRSQLTKSQKFIPSLYMQHQPLVARDVGPPTLPNDIWYKIFSAYDKHDDLVWLWTSYRNVCRAWHGIIEGIFKHRWLKKTAILVTNRKTYLDTSIHLLTMEQIYNTNCLIKTLTSRITRQYHSDSTACTSRMATQRKRSLA